MSDLFSVDVVIKKYEHRGKKTTCIWSDYFLMPSHQPASVADTDETEAATERATLQEYTKQELITLVHEGRRGNGSVMAGCPIPHLSIKVTYLSDVLPACLPTAQS